MNTCKKQTDNQQEIKHVQM